MKNLKVEATVKMFFFWITMKNKFMDIQKQKQIAIQDVSSCDTEPLYMFTVPPGSQTPAELTAD